MAYKVLVVEDNTDCRELFAMIIRHLGCEVIEADDGEIGVQKALGARRRYILGQFLAEALTITFIGGVLGVVLAYVVALSVGRLTLYSAFAKNGEAGDIRLIIAPGTLIISTVILGGVGLISGMIPALRASRLDPIEALRHE